MKVGMTTGSLSRDAGGLFESVRALAKNLAELGVDVGVYGLCDAHWEQDARAWEPLKAQAFSYFGPRSIAWSPQMTFALEKDHSDLLHLHGLWQFSSVATRHLWRQKHTPYLISPRGMLDSWALAHSRWKKRIVAWMFENSVMREATCLHALCEAEADAIRAYGLKQRIEIVPNGVVLPEMGNGRCEIRNAQGRRRLLFLGRIHPKKGLVGFLKAWAEMKNPNSGIIHSKDWQLVIAGWDQGGHESELKVLCGELGLKVFSFTGSGSSESDSGHLKLNSYKLKTCSSEAADVIFKGPAFGEEKDQLLRGADAFVLPSFSEGLPMSVLEAWAYGLPVLMTPECNLPEGYASQAAIAIRNGEIGNANCEGVRALLDMSDSDRIEMGRRGRRLVEMRFTWLKVASKMKSLYEDILVGPG